MPTTKNIKNKAALEDLCWRLECFSIAFADLKSACDFRLACLEQLKRARNPEKVAKLRMFVRAAPVALDVDNDDGVFEGNYRDDLDALESAIYAVLGSEHPVTTKARTVPQDL